MVRVQVDDESQSEHTCVISKMKKEDSTKDVAFSPDVLKEQRPQKHSDPANELRVSNELFIHINCYDR